MEFEEQFADALAQVPEEFFDRSRFVPGVGDLDAAVMLVGEAPGANEVEEGEPFVGRAGDVLTDILDSLGVDRSEVYITNLVKIRPPDNRDPTDAEIDAWRPVLEAELDRVDPDVVVPLGNFATRDLTGTDRGISQVHGETFLKDGRTVLPTYHPAATLYSPDTRPDLEKDLEKAFSGPSGGQTTLG